MIVATSLRKQIKLKAIWFFQRRQRAGEGGASSSCYQITIGLCGGKTLNGSPLKDIYRKPIAGRRVRRGLQLEDHWMNFFDGPTGGGRVD